MPARIEKADRPRGMATWGPYGKTPTCKADSDDWGADMWIDGAMDLPRDIQTTFAVFALHDQESANHARRTEHGPHA